MPRIRLPRGWLLRYYGGWVSVTYTCLYRHRQNTPVRHDEAPERLTLGPGARGLARRSGAPTDPEGTRQSPRAASER